MAKRMKIEAEPREETGSGASRRRRRGGSIPAVVYGAGGPSIAITVDPRRVLQILHSDLGHNALFTLEVKGQAPARAMLKDWQVDPLRGDLLHADMIRIGTDERLRLNVPVRLTGEPQGVKLQGGVLDFVLREIEIECLPDDIPEHVAADVGPLAIGQGVRVSDLQVDPKVKVLTDPSHIVAHVMMPKVEEEEKPAAEVAEAAPAEPEIIRKGKAEAAEGEEAEGGAKPETK